MGKKLDEFYRDEIKSLLKESTIGLSEVTKQSRLLYGTFGYHDSEPPHSVILRKKDEVILNDIGFWGTGINGKNIEKIRAFCEKTNEPVYLLLKYTSSKQQNKTGMLKKEVIDVRKIKEEGGYYETYIDENGIKKDLQPERTQIYIKGNKNQGTAFVVEKYYYLEDTFKRNEFLKNYEGVTDRGEVRASAEGLFNQAACYLLDRKFVDAKEQMTGDAWGIVLKLKAPYVVACDEFIERYNN